MTVDQAYKKIRLERFAAYMPGENRRKYVVYVDDKPDLDEDGFLINSGRHKVGYVAKINPSGRWRARVLGALHTEHATYRDAMRAMLGRWIAQENGRPGSRTSC